MLVNGSEAIGVPGERRVESWRADPARWSRDGAAGWGEGAIALETRLTIHHPAGLHARPASKFVETAQRFKCDISVTFSGEKVNAKSILNILSLGVEQGDEVIIRAEGGDAQEAIETLTQLVEEDFGDELDAEET